MEATVNERETGINAAITEKANHANLRVLQAGGHPDQVLIDKTNPQRIIKKTNKTELHFYQTLVHQLQHHSSHSSLRTLQPLWSGWRPQFFGTFESPDISLKTENENLIILENLTRGRPVRTTRKARSETQQSMAASDEDGHSRFELFKHPNVVDIKLGQRLYDDHASAEKIERMKKAALETTSAAFGIRLTGAQLWDNLRREYRLIPKSFGKSIDPTGSDLDTKFNFLFPISDWSSDGEQQQDDHEKFRGLTRLAGHLPSDMMKVIIDRSIIPNIKRVMDHVTSFEWRIYGSSLLIIFEANFETLDAVFSSQSSKSESEQTLIEDLSTVKMIDFAHVYLADSPDPGLLKGFHSVLNLFEQLSLKLGSLESIKIG